MVDGAQLVEHWPAMLRVAQSVLGTAEDAEDCAASALLQALERPPTGVANLEAYLVTIAKRRAIDICRARERAGRIDARIAAGSTAEVADVAEDIVLAAQARWVDQQCHVLLNPTANAVLRRVADGERAIDIAQDLGITVRAVESQLLRARRMMRAALAGIAALGMGLRKMFMSGAPATSVAAAAVMWLTLPGAGGPSGPGASGRPGPQPLAAPSTHPDPWTQDAEALPVSWPAFGRGGNAGPPGSTTSESTLIKISGPSGASAAVMAGDSGTHEDNIVEVVEACASRFEVNQEHIGC